MYELAKNIIICWRYLLSLFIFTSYDKVYINKRQILEKNLTLKSLLDKIDIKKYSGLLINVFSYNSMYLPNSFCKSIIIEKLAIKFQLFQIPKSSRFQQKIKTDEFCDRTIDLNRHIIKVFR